MDIVGLWGRTIKDAVNRFAKNQPREVKEDYEQECFIVVIQIQEMLEHLISTQGELAANNYVYGTCRKRIHDLQGVTKKHQQESLGGFDVSREPESESNLPFDEHEIDQAIKHLSREEQHVVREIYFMGKTERDVAKSLNKPKTWVHGVKQDAIAQLRKIMVSK